MKKIIMTLGVVSVMALASCSNSEKTQATDDAQSTEATETAAPEAKAEAAGVSSDPFIANLQKTDSTVKVTPSGLGYKVIKEGNGSRPNISNTVTVKYTGKHTNGEVFDSSKDQTIDFPLTGVIKGFSEGISLMPVGSIYELYIPGDLGYGPQGTPGGPIGPNETLIFEVELVDFK